MDKDTVELLDLILDWWEDAQYWSEDNDGDERNVFDEDPEFIKKAKHMKAERVTHDKR